ncbi:hypothetical protein EV424DRAFT_1351074 [Suillus variegatus]|nr:hypothetical protein EV424DRAFT_1351074 [Suillus variegatus]
MPEAWACLSGSQRRELVQLQVEQEENEKTNMLKRVIGVDNSIRATQTGPQSICLFDLIKLEDFPLCLNSKAFGKPMDGRARAPGEKIALRIYEHDSSVPPKLLIVQAVSSFSSSYVLSSNRSKTRARYGSLISDVVTHDGDDTVMKVEDGSGGSREYPCIARVTHGKKAKFFKAETQGSRKDTTSRRNSTDDRLRPSCLVSDGRSPQTPTSPSSTTQTSFQTTAKVLEGTAVDSASMGVTTTLSSADKDVTLDIRWTILCDLFLMLIADSIYEMRNMAIRAPKGEQHEHH